MKAGWKSRIEERIYFEKKKENYYKRLLEIKDLEHQLKVSDYQKTVSSLRKVGLTV